MATATRVLTRDEEIDRISSILRNSLEAKEVIIAALAEIIRLDRDALDIATSVLPKDKKIVDLDSEGRGSNSNDNLSLTGASPGPKDPEYMPPAMREPAQKKRTRVTEVMFWVKQGPIGKMYVGDP